MVPAASAVIELHGACGFGRKRGACGFGRKRVFLQVLHSLVQPIQHHPAHAFTTNTCTCRKHHCLDFVRCYWSAPYRSAPYRSVEDGGLHASLLPPCPRGMPSLLHSVTTLGPLQIQIWLSSIMISRCCGGNIMQCAAHTPTVTVGI